jgi:hypothetical protein
LVEADVRGGSIKMWGGKYRALVDEGKEDIVKGAVSVAKNKEEEDALRDHKGANFEVVRCEMELEHEKKKRWTDIPMVWKRRSKRCRINRVSIVADPPTPPIYPGSLYLEHNLPATKS